MQFCEFLLHKSPANPNSHTRLSDVLQGQSGRYPLFIQSKDSAPFNMPQKFEPEVQSVSMPRRNVRSEADLDVLLTEVKKSVLDKLSSPNVA